MQLIWLVPAFPLIGFLVTSFGQKRLGGISAGILASSSVFASFICSLYLFFTFKGEAQTVQLFNWIQSGSLSIPFSFLLDQLSLLMLLIVTGIGTLIHIYSIGYMKSDQAFARFFSYLNLFVFFMLLLVLGSNYVVLFAGWEGVGLCSYLLIGFWFKNHDFNKAANKAFIMNRIGDLGFLLGIILMFITFGSVSYDKVFDAAKLVEDNQPVIIAITMLLFIGAMGKSAQIPLYTWLPDAMAGPTPVSALIHAATMVTAGIYMVVRSNVLYSIAPATLSFIAIIGTLTALFAATIAMKQTDIKKVLAYSTVSQLGYMFVALGVGAYSTAMFHVTTHAFFKALLFLAAGSVIHAVGGEQDIRKMGGLKKKLPITFAVFMIGTLAISGIPPLAGFFSKDEILAKVSMQSPILFYVLAFTSVLTAMYMFRLLFLTFYGGFRGSKEQAHHLHESPSVMTWPLVLLAVLSTVGGFMGMPTVFSEQHLLHNFLAPIISSPAGLLISEPSHLFEWMLMGSSVFLLAIIIVWSYRRYVSREAIPSLHETDMSLLTKVLYNKYYIDELYSAVFVKPLRAFGSFFQKYIDKAFLDGIIGGVNKGVVLGSQTVRLIQTGNIGFYIFAMVFGIIAILLFNLLL
ncbi:MAG: NADH-quinone oxidoreductase subunit L [Bacteroidetes bacterium]|nr:MAG: NADH-quinone oxidoreductase subunit L [Bacteroidota bacterium]